MSTTTISIDQVFNLLNDPDHPNRDRRIVNNTPGLTEVGEVINTDVVSKTDIMQALLYSHRNYSYQGLFNKAFQIINDSTFDDDTKLSYIKEFISYFDTSAFNSLDNPDPTPKSSSSGFRSFAKIGESANTYMDSLNDFKGDVAQIGYYSVLETENPSGLPSIIPSSISIQEQLLNQPVPTIRSKSAGVIPDHRSKHLVTLDILYPSFEAFSTRQKDYPSFINLLNMFKFMPISSINSSILTSAFVSKYTFPRFFDLVSQTFAKDEFKHFHLMKKTESQVRYIGLQAFGSLDREYGLADIKSLFSYDDTNLDIGLSAVADSIFNQEQINAGKRQDIFDSETLKDFISTYQKSFGFPIPVGFKSASVQTHGDMPGAVIARFGFGIVESSAFPYGSIMYRDKEGKPSFNPDDCYYGKKYVSIASQKLFDQTGIDIKNITKTSKDANLNPVGLNDFRLYYFDFEHGHIMFDTSNPRYAKDSVVLEKISGAFNTKSAEIPLMGSKFPTIQYMGMNSNACQLVFNITDKQVIADFMELKSRLVDSEKNQSIHSSFAIVENTFINSLGISRITPQSVTIDSDPDMPELYRLTVNFIENFQEIGDREKLTLEKGVQATSSLRAIWKYFYDLYLIWWHKNIRKNPYTDSWGRYVPFVPNPKDVPNPKERDVEFFLKLDNLMAAIGIQEKYDSFDAESASVLNPGRAAHDVYYGPLLIGIIEEYAKAKGNNSATGYLEYDFPALLQAGIIDRDNIQKTLVDIAFGVNERPVFVGMVGETPAVSWTDSIDEDNVLKNLLFSNSFSIEDVAKVKVRRSSNIVDMFHQNDAPIPLNIWISTFESILKRQFTKGTDVLVSFDQMDTSFAMLYYLIAEYENSYKFNIVTDPKTGEEITEFKAGYYMGTTYRIPSTEKEYLARLNLTAIKKKKQEIESVNKQIINLYPDLFLPTYEDLIRDELQSEDFSGFPWENQMLSTVEKKDEFIRDFLTVFAPKYGDTGTVPNFTSFKDLEMNPKEISAMTSVTEEHYIDPDIFYYRQRDKNNLHAAINTAAKEKEEQDENLKRGRTITLPVAWRDIQDKTRLELERLGKIPKGSYLKDDNSDIERYISTLFDDSISTFVNNSRYDSSDSYAVTAFQSLGVNEIGLKTSEDIKRYFKALGLDDDVNEEDEAQQVKANKVTHIEFITNDGKIIGDIVPDKNSKYRVLPGIRIGQTPSYYTNVEDMSFVMDDNYKVSTDQRSLLHTPDLTDSVLKSFPTIRLYFIEEDRDYNFLEDDFYGYSDIIECNITSHIYDNDVCRMKLANFSGTLSTMQFTDYEYYTSVKAPDESRKDNKINVGKVENVNIVDDANEKFLSKIMLRPGVHIMVKLGYGNNLDTLKTVFTGEIAEIKPGPIVELVAQGYQTELHNEFGGFLQEGFWETGYHALLDNTNLKFGFMKIINYILLMNDGQNKKLAKNSMMHLGEAFSVKSYQRGLFGKIDPKYGYNRANLIREYLGTSTTQDFIAEMQGETFSWFDSFMESRYFGFSGTDLMRNVYISDSNHTDINVAQEWLITNAPVIDSLREVVRYMPNYIATVVPYEQDATLFIGDPSQVYQYRKPNLVEQKYDVKFNGPLNIIRNQSAYGQKNASMNRIIDSVNERVANFSGKVQYANRLYAQNKNYGYPQESAAVLSEILFTDLTMPLSQRTQNINMEVLAKIFCNYYNIQYESSKKGKYLGLLEQILMLPISYIKGKGASYIRAQRRERRVREYTDNRFYENWIADWIPLDAYAVEVLREGQLHKDLLEQGRLARKLDMINLIGKDIKNLIENSIEQNYAVNFDDLLFGLEARSKFPNAINSLSVAKVHFSTILYFLSRIIDERQNFVENQAAQFAKESGDYKLNNVIPWNYKIFRDHHVISSEHDLIANNLSASESDMWSAVALRVPMDTVETVNGFTWQAFQWGIEEENIDPTAGTYRIDSDQTFGLFPNKIGGGVNYKGFYPGPRDILENFTEINATTPSLAQNVLKFRLAQGLSKMYRGNLIFVGRNIKPYDQIQLVDNVNNMYGKVMVERVVHHFTSTTGWTTTVVPCALTTVNSQQASYNRSFSDKLLYTLGQGKTGRYIMNAITFATFGSAALGVRGGIHFLARMPLGFIKRVFQGTFTSSGSLWAAAKYPYELGKRIALSQRSTFAARAMARSSWIPIKGVPGTLLASSLVSGASDVAYQFNNMSISQSIALHQGETVHQPCHISLLTYNGAPFMAGLEDPLNTMSNHDSWAQLSEEFEYAWREWWQSRAGKVKPADAFTSRNLESGGD